ncbi:MAG: cryptochrome/photolyase family protein [Flavitalea sp.]
MADKINIFWFRRDLRLEDNAGLFQALSSGKKVVPLFIFDTEILNKLEDKKDRRVTFIYKAVKEIHEKISALNSRFEVRYGKPLEIFGQLLKEYDIDTVFTNHDYEPYAIRRDSDVKQLLSSSQIAFRTFKDQVIFERLEVCKDDGTPYTVFTPYSKKWKATLKKSDYQSWTTEDKFGQFVKLQPVPLISLESMGFEEVQMEFPSIEVKAELIKKYQQQRDFPAVSGTSRMGVHLRFGTVSIRELVRQSITLSETYLNELIWRDFYQMILANFPRVGHGLTFRPEYEAIPWRNNEIEFERWCVGETGYPIVDAGMRELNETGFMHNRVRMIVASFLTKHLLIDWKWGEAYFADKLLDFDFASNNGGWQWAAGTGCDAAPYFRVFNPYLQTKKFDAELKYIRKWIPELETMNYPSPIVEHEFARKRVLEVYSKALKSN